MGLFEGKVSAMVITSTDKNALIELNKRIDAELGYPNATTKTFSEVWEARPGVYAIKTKERFHAAIALEKAKAQAAVSKGEDTLEDLSVALLEDPKNQPKEWEQDGQAAPIGRV